MKIYQSSRRTINSGEVVTFATGFQEYDGVFGKAYKPTGGGAMLLTDDIIDAVSSHREARMLIHCGMLLESRLPGRLWQRAKELAESADSCYNEEMNRSDVSASCGMSINLD